MRRLGHVRCADPPVGAHKVRRSVGAGSAVVTPQSEEGTKCRHKEVRERGKSKDGAGYARKTAHFMCNLTSGAAKGGPCWAGDVAAACDIMTFREVARPVERGVVRGRAAWGPRARRRATATGCVCGHRDVGRQAAPASARRGLPCAAPRRRGRSAPRGRRARRGPGGGGRDPPCAHGHNIERPLPVRHPPIWLWQIGVYCCTDAIYML